MFLYSYNRRLARRHNRWAIQHHIWKLVGLHCRHRYTYGYYLQKNFKASCSYSRLIWKVTFGCVPCRYCLCSRRSQGKFVPDGSRPSEEERAKDGAKIFCLVLLVRTGWLVAGLHSCSIRPTKRELFLWLLTYCSFNNVWNYGSGDREKPLSSVSPTKKRSNGCSTYSCSWYQKQALLQKKSTLDSLARRC